MSLYDVPTHDGYKILTHTSSRRFSKNGFGQVGNVLFPKHPINPQAVKASSIYNKNISGISEAGYGRAYPYYGLSRYAGAGSPRRTLSAYTGAGSPRRSLLGDAYINDNVPPGTLRVRRPGLPGRSNLRGLADDAAPVDTAQDYNLYAPVTAAAPAPETSSSVWGDITGAFGSLFSSATKAAASSGSTAISNAISGSVNPPTRTVMTAARPAAASTAKILGMSSTTLLIAGAAAAYFLTRNK